MGSPVHYVCCGKEMLGWIREKMVTPESAPRGDRLFASSLITVGNDISACSDPCVLSKDY